MNSEEVFELLKRKFDFLNSFVDNKKHFVIRGRLINSLDLDPELDFFGTDNGLGVTICDGENYHILSCIPLENITEQKLDELLSQITKINTAVYMIKKIMKGME